MHFCVIHIFVLLLLTIPLRITAQDAGARIQLETMVESIAEQTDGETDLTLITEDLEAFADEPLNINQAGREQLARLHLLNDIQIQKILDYRNTYGAFYSIYELNTIEGFTPELLKRLEPFIFFGPEEKKNLKFKQRLKYGRHELLLRSLGTIEEPTGYKKREDETKPFEGNRARYYARYRFKAGDDISAGITAEKDPGEPFFSGSNPEGFDFYSGHVQFRINSVIEKVFLGDYTVRSGQGLVIWQGFSAGRSAYALSVSKAGQGLRSYASANETMFFRGAGITVNLNETRLDLFFSGKKRDANLVRIDSTKKAFTSLQSSGYHRTTHETEDKNSLKAINSGLIASRQWNHLKLGTTFLYRRFSLPFIPRERPDTRFRFRGTENYIAGTDYLFSKGKLRLFGEAAISKSRGKAFLQGALGHLNDRLQISSLFRHFEKNYHALWAGPFAKGSSASNESGLYFGTRILPVKFVTVSAYSDFYRSEWISYTTAGPSAGREWMLQTDIDFSENLRFCIRYKSQERDKKFKKDKIYMNHPELYRKTRFQFRIKPRKILRLTTRLEHIFYKGMEKENGFLIFQDMQLSQLPFPLKVWARVAWFKTKSYYSRIYAYENDLLYSFSIPACFGEGIRTYINLKYKITGDLEMWFKLGSTIKKGEESLGSGYNEIPGNKKTEAKLQLRLKI